MGPSSFETGYTPFTPEQQGFLAYQDQVMEAYLAEQARELAVGAVGMFVGVVTMGTAVTDPSFEISAPTPVVEAVTVEDEEEMFRPSPINRLGSSAINGVTQDTAGDMPNAPLATAA